MGIIRESLNPIRRGQSLIEENQRMSRQFYTESERRPATPADYSEVASTSVDQPQPQVQVQVKSRSANPGSGNTHRQARGDTDFKSKTLAIAAFPLAARFNSAVLAQAAPVQPDGMGSSATLTATFSVANIRDSNPQMALFKQMIADDFSRLIGKSNTQNFDAWRSNGRLLSFAAPTAKVFVQHAATVYPDESVAHYVVRAPFLIAQAAEPKKLIKGSDYNIDADILRAKEEKAAAKSEAARKKAERRVRKLLKARDEDIDREPTPAELTAMGFDVFEERELESTLEESLAFIGLGGMGAIAVAGALGTAAGAYAAKMAQRGIRRRKIKVVGDELKRLARQTLPNIRKSILTKVDNMYTGDAQRITRNRVETLFKEMISSVSGLYQITRAYRSNAEYYRTRNKFLGMIPGLRGLVKQSSDVDAEAEANAMIDAEIARWGA